MSTTVEREIKRNYVVSDYSGFVDVFDKLKDARTCLRDLGEGRFSTLTSETTETITIKTKKVIQSLR